MSFEHITISANIHAPRDVVWKAFTEAEHITQWNFASDDWCCPRAEVELQQGGSYKARMEAKDGSFGFDFEAIYEKLDPNRALTLLMGDGRRARTTFVSNENETLVTTVFDAETLNSIAMQRDGWQAILDNFKAYVEKSTAVD